MPTTLVMNRLSALPVAGGRRERGFAGSSRRKLSCPGGSFFRARVPGGAPVTLFVGTSGWQYAEWRGRFYPAAAPRQSWLGFYAERFATVEVNNAFYRLPELSTFERWRESVPAGFVFSLKASRFLTHLRRLRDPAEPVARLLERAAGLGEQLGPVLLQLPPDLRAEPERLDATLSCFPAGVRVVVEPRHPSWFNGETRALLASHGAALCLADSRGSRSPQWRTADFGYVRFHAGRATPSPCYGQRALATWARRLGELWPEGSDLYAYFNNDASGCAPRDAVLFAGCARRAGLSPSRVPPLAEVRAG